MYNMSERKLNLNERGSVLVAIISIVVIVVLAAAAFLMGVNQSWWPAPEFIAEQSFMESILPPEEEDDTDLTVTISEEDNLRASLIQVRRDYQASQTTIETLMQQLAEKDRTIQDREDEIALLRNTLNLARDQNIQAAALIHENMDPEESAIILAKLGATDASLILGSMRESKAADVLSLLDEDLATEITQILAGFNEEEIETTPPLTPGSGTLPPGSDTTPPL